jgi:hypothetical protein
MHLTPAELERLEAMCAAGQVRSDPPTLSRTDRMLDAMIAASRTRAKPRPETAPPTQAAASPDVPPRAMLHRPRRLPYRLEELLEIRRALLRGDSPEL